jgi:hypothetical protein
LLAAGDADGLERALGLLGRAGAVLRQRADVLSLGQTPTGGELVGPAMSPRWVRRREDGRLVALLREAARATADPVALLTDPARVVEAEAALRRVGEAGRGRGRRWWVTLYRDVFECLRGKFADLPDCGPDWQPPTVLRREQAVGALGWLRQVEERAGRGEALPAALRAALIDAELVSVNGVVPCARLRRANDTGDGER